MAHHGPAKLPPLISPTAASRAALHVIDLDHVLDEHERNQLDATHAFERERQQQLQRARRLKEERRKHKQEAAVAAALLSGAVQGVAGDTAGQLTTRT